MTQTPKPNFNVIGNNSFTKVYNEDKKRNLNKNSRSNEMVGETELLHRKSVDDTYDDLASYFENNMKSINSPALDRYSKAQAKLNIDSIN